MSADGLASRESVEVICSVVAFSAAVIAGASYSYLSAAVVVSSVAVGLAVGCAMLSVDGAVRREWYRGGVHLVALLVALAVAVLAPV